ncbi:hypothetical protein NDU88_000463 [Pleurodeles waltl]|uniref:Uncharacterized protein n=1 Tax=Pleurodeles waltl TaxID=8319 RepID=A0AAV7NBF1_PLEWA|nr:hypothetical protein NDU88_000463 [Pleurodeles waltl]
MRPGSSSPSPASSARATSQTLVYLPGHRLDQAREPRTSTVNVPRLEGRTMKRGVEWSPSRFTASRFHLLTCEAATARPAALRARAGR